MTTADRTWKLALPALAALALLSGCTSAPTATSTPAPTPAPAGLPGSGGTNDSPILAADGSVHMKTAVAYQSLSTNKHDATFLIMGDMAQSLDVFDDSGLFVVNLPVWNMDWSINNMTSNLTVSELEASGTGTGKNEIHAVQNGTWIEVQNTKMNKKIGVRHASKHLLPATIIIGGMDQTPKDSSGTAIPVGAVCIHYCTDNTCGSGVASQPSFGKCPAY